MIEELTILLSEYWFIVKSPIHHFEGKWDHFLKERIINSVEDRLRILYKTGIKGEKSALES